ncbi:hypothetical protein C2S53_019055 [Perilla frutescens var. hirtella]|uniref:F-box domain-containing protein n=1 Tax=Perilla frutescens var. hirtella TaxID=608512 RepID=A0AAD4NWW2_PERFH|nr:hypothetical protein C2S53_019055 [Perilla frutescens var. hirtella]
MEKGKRIETVNGVINLLPEDIILHIQSFLTGREAARAALLSKSWYNAWFTRPTLEFDEHDFKNYYLNSNPFEEFATKTMQRYHDLNLKITSFRLRTYKFTEKNKLVSHNLIVDAMKIGATDLKIELPFFELPPEVLESETLVRLSVTRCNINVGKLKCSRRLESLSLSNLFIDYRDTIYSGILTLAKLKCLFLERVNVYNLFFSNFESRFPCLKDLSLVECQGYTRIEIDSTSLERLTFVQQNALKAVLDVPNIRKFSYTSYGLPSLSFKSATSREWESDISINCRRLQSCSWILSLKRRLLTKLSTSRISLSLNRLRFKYDRSDVKAVAKPVVLENLTIDSSSAFSSDLLLQLFKVCHPKFITHRSKTEGDLLDVSNMSGFMVVKVEVYVMICGEWRLKKPTDGASTTPVKFCFQLRWGS